MISDIQIGSIVISKSGRDKGKPFVVTQTADGYAFLCDGKTRPVSNQKKKKFMHLQQTSSVSREIAQKLEIGDTLLDADFQKAIKQFMRQE